MAVPLSPLLAEIVNPADLLNQALQWIDGLGGMGGLVFIAIYTVATVALIPGSLLTLGAGAIFGVWLGAVYVFVGATLGAIAAFLVGRYLARNWVSHKIAANPRFAAIDRAVATNGLKIVCLTRLSPVFPFVLLNYAFGITGVSLRDYALGSIGMIPATLMYVYIGSLAGDLARVTRVNAATVDNASILKWVLNLIGLGATIAVTLLITRIARNALATVVDGSTADNNSGNNSQKDSAT